MTQHTTQEQTSKQQILSTLSMELVGVPEDEQCKIFEQFEEGIKQGVFLAAPDRRQKFTAKYINLKGQMTEEQRTEEHIQITDDWTKWFTEQRAASRYHVKRFRADFTVTPDELKTQPDTFEMMAKMRRELLAEKKSKARQTAKSAPKPGAKTAIQTKGKSSSSKATIPNATPQAAAPTTTSSSAPELSTSNQNSSGTVEPTATPSSN